MQFKKVGYFALFFSLLSLPYVAYPQSTEAEYPKTFKLDRDTFHVKYSYGGERYPVKITKRDTVDSGTDGFPGLAATIYFDKDSVHIPYKNFPYWQVHYIPIQIGERKVIYRLHFNGVYSYFSPKYMEGNYGASQIEIPEVYELANVIWMLSPSGQRATDLNKEGAYYQKVVNYFKPYMDHPVFKKLDFPADAYSKKYYDFRENSFTFNFKGDELVYEGPYFYVMGDDWDNYTSLFLELLPLVQDFAKQSDYRKFYRANRSYYAQQIERQKELMPVRNMWSWLEREFPKRKFQSYKIVFSPLIGGSHSTQNFTNYNYERSEWFRESVMFICGADRYDKDPALNERQKQGLMSGVVFTEIDHNYVNPVSNGYKKQIDSIFADRGVWADSKTNWYASPVPVFNEYMTHALFCLWVAETYDPETAAFVIANREKLMTDRRGFTRFREFNQALLSLRKDKAETKVMDLYPEILSWCKTQVNIDNHGQAADGGQ